MNNCANCARLAHELEAAKKVADAAVRYFQFDGDAGEDAEIWFKLAHAVAEYRAANPPLSPAKQAAIDKGLEKADAVEKIYDCAAEPQ